MHPENAASTATQESSSSTSSTADEATATTATPASTATTATDSSTQLRAAAATSGTARQPNSTPPKPPPAATGVRSLDGTGNNLANPDWGSAGADLLRIAPAAYEDGVSAPAGADRPSAREISNALAAHEEGDVKNERLMSAFIYAWGQFIDHDMDLTTAASPPEAFNISVPAGDPSFDPNGTGTQEIPLNRSNFDPDTGTAGVPREQINDITAFLDGSMIYGSDATRAAALRTFQGGKLKTSAGGLLPLNTDGLANANDAHRVADDQLFLAGDVRANENIELTSLHTLFVREHNRLAEQIAAKNPRLSDEEIYQQARRLVIAEVQSITYNEFLPALLGPNAMRYTGYQADVNPGIATEFSTAAFRVGHTMLGNDVEFLDNQGNEVAEEIPLSEAFFNPDVIRETGIDPILKYLASDLAEEIDTQVVDSVRNFLFGPPGAGGLDLASLNLQRGRDHGLADYNSTREAYGLSHVTDFSEITSDVEVQHKLRELYGSVDNIDLWIGGLAEDHVAGSSVGETFQRIIADQFERLRDGDRFWYQRTLSGTTLSQIEHTTLSDIIRRNTEITNIQDNAFFFKSSISGTVFTDRNANGRKDSTDRGLAGVTVQLKDDTGEVITTAVTDSQGRYRFDSSSGITGPGDYTVSVVVPSGQQQTTTDPAAIPISRGDMNVSGVNFGVTGTGQSTTPPSRPRVSQGGAVASNAAVIDALFAEMSGRQDRRRR